MDCAFPQPNSAADDCPCLCVQQEEHNRMIPLASSAPRHRLHTLALCASLLVASPALAQTQPPAPTSPAPVSPKTDAPVVITKPLATQPGSKPVSRRQARQADDAYLEGSAFIQKNDPAQAEKAFERAVKLNPEKQEYAVAAAIARENVVSGMVRKSQLMRSAGNPAGADALLAAALKIDPDNRIVTEHMRQDEARIEIAPAIPGTENVDLRFAPLIEFAPNQTTQSFHFRADAHEMLRTILLAYGIKAQFNTDIPSTSPRIDVDNVNFQQMLPILQLLTGTFLAPLNATTALVLKDTPENHNQFDRYGLETVYMPGFSTEEIHDASVVLQQVLGLQHVVVGTAGGTISIRAQQNLLKIANYELADLMDGGSEMVLEMKVYAISKTNTKDIGIPLTSSYTAFSIVSEASQVISQFSSQISAAIANGIIPANATPVQIAGFLFGAGLLNNNPVLSGLVGTFGGGLTYTGLSAASLPSINFGLNKSEAKSLEDIQMRVGDKKTATFRVGTKYPIVTASFSAGGISPSLLAGVSSTQLAALGLTSATAAAAAAQVSIPQIQYEDLGLTLKATPTVLRTGDIYLNLDLKVEALGGSSLNGIPILDNRAYTSGVTLQEGQTAMLATSMSRQESDAVSGIPGLSEIPGFQSTTNKSTETDTSELVITLTPHIVRRGHDRIAGLPLALPQSAATNDEE
jgi:general secretion pathway protein D